MFQKMQEKRELTIRQAISTALHSGETLFCLSRSHSSESYYAVVMNVQQQYIIFRLSEHGTYSGFLSIPTFQVAPGPKLANLIRGYLEGNSWANLSYEDFFALLIIIFGRKKHVNFQIDDLFSIFSESKQGMIFYQVRSYNHGKRIDDNGLESKTNRIFRKLYALGLISSYTQPDQTLLVYVSEAGKRLVDQFSGQYISQFIDDYQNFDWGFVKVPQPKDESNN